MRREILENIYNSKRNVIISGDMSTGKTSNVGFDVVRKMIDLDESMFILDSREEYLKKYYKELKNKDYNIVIINTRDFYKSEGWNMLEYPYSLYKSNRSDYAIKYLDMIAKEIFLDKEAMDPFWSNSAGDYFKGITLALFDDAREEEINLSSVNSVVNDTDSDSKINYVAEYFRTKDSTNMAYVCASGTVFSPRETMGGIVATVKQKLAPIVNRRSLNLLLNKSTFDYDDLLNKKSAVFFINSEENMSLSSLTSIFISQLYSVLVDSGSKNKFNFVLDNFDTVSNIDNLKGMLSSSISNNIKFYIVTRDKEKLEEQYSSYINRVSNAVSLDEKKVVIRINNEISECDNEVVYNNDEYSMIDYPSLNQTDISIFNLKRYILENLRVDNED